jgi:hypothetical protein
MADKKKGKKGNAKEKSITDILSESRNVLYGKNLELTSVLTSVIVSNDPDRNGNTGLKRSSNTHNYKVLSVDQGGTGSPARVISIHTLIRRIDT